MQRSLIPLLAPMENTRLQDGNLYLASDSRVNAERSHLHFKSLPFSSIKSPKTMICPIENELFLYFSGWARKS